MAMDAQISRRYRLALAGLLHDLGKFAHRAGVAFREGWRDPETRAEFRYAHAYLTYVTLRELLPEAWADVALLAGYHHAPKTPDQALLRLADQLSTGERASGNANRDDSDRTAHPQMLHPIFAQIRLPGGQGHPDAGRTDRFFVPLAPLRLTRTDLFPQAQAPPAAEVWARYEHLWQRFTHAAADLKTAAEAGSLELPGYLEAMQALLMRTTWAIPAAYWRPYADISLYDHSRVTAALAVALADFDTATLERLHAAWHARTGPAWEAPVALLIGGDLSGVQKFIYTIAAKGAAKSLRGRSFYLQLLTEAVLRFVLRELDLPYTNVIYSGGGNFYLLAPLHAATRLPDLRVQVTQRLWHYHGADVYLALGAATVPLKGFQPGAFPTYWGQMHANMQHQKSRRYAELAPDALAALFEPPSYGGNPRAVCSVCGSEARAVDRWDEWEGQERICTLCRSFVDPLGKALAQAVAVRWQWRAAPQPGEGPATTARFDDILRAFGAEARVLTSWNALAADAVAVNARLSLWLLDDPPPGQAWPRLPYAVWARYAVTHIPTVADANEAQAIAARLSKADLEEQPPKPGLPKTFTHLQVQTQGGFHRLGVLRMDVDHLGRIFQQGLGSMATPSRLATLSLQMSLFFEGWVERLLKADPWRNLVYAVYAGGDDLFLLGPWDQMPELALRIVDDFAAYTGGHPDLHLSGGLAFVHGKYPIYQAAQDAGEAESQAKAAGRNRFTFLGHVWTWDEFRALRTRYARLRALVHDAAGAGEESGSRAARSLLRVLQDLARAMEARNGPNGQQVVWGPWMWRAAYQLHRMAERDPARGEAYLAIARELEADHFANLPMWGAAARWAELYVRKAHS